MASKRLVAQHEIQKADPRARRTAIVTLGLATLAGLVLMLVVESQLSAWLEWITEDPEQMDDRLVLCGWGLALGVVVPMLLLAAYLWRLGSRIVHSGVFPPPGIRVVRDTRVLFGRRAADASCLSILSLPLSAGSGQGNHRCRAGGVAAGDRERGSGAAALRGLEAEGEVEAAPRRDGGGAAAHQAERRSGRGGGDAEPLARAPVLRAFWRTRAADRESASE